MRRDRDRRGADHLRRQLRDRVDPDVSKTPVAGSQIPLEPGLGSAFDPTRTVARASTNNSTPGFLSCFGRRRIVPLLWRPPGRCCAAACESRRVSRGGRSWGHGARRKRAVWEHGADLPALHLDDIDWRAGELTVRGKGSRTERPPAPREVGEALVAYVCAGRGRASCREVFVRAGAARPAHSEWRALGRSRRLRSRRDDADGHPPVAPHGRDRDVARGRWA